jgi:hypothetical protein
MDDRFLIGTAKRIVSYLQDWVLLCYSPGKEYKVQQYSIQ